jgi:hypothetical protein
LVNYKELSIILTGKEGVIRSNRPIPKEYRERVEKLFSFLTEWAENKGDDFVAEAKFESIDNPKPNCEMQMK